MMNREELIALLEAVRRDMIRHNGVPNEIAQACQFAIWHLIGEPSFVERNDRKRAELAERDC